MFQTCGNDSTAKIPSDINNDTNNTDKIANSHNNNHSLDIPEENQNIRNEVSQDDSTDKIILPKQTSGATKTPSKKSNRFTDGKEI